MRKVALSGSSTQRLAMIRITVWRLAALSLPCVEPESKSNVAPSWIFYFLFFYFLGRRLSIGTDTTHLQALPCSSRAGADLWIEHQIYHTQAGFQPTEAE